MGKYAPIIYGEIAGLKKGVSTDLMLREHTKELDNDSLDGEYLVGFGIGFTKGQIIREKLRKTKTDLQFDIKLDLLSKFLEKNDGFPAYSEFHKKVNSYLDNQNNWDESQISENLFKSTIELIDKKLYKRALDNISDYYNDNYFLKAFLEFEDFKHLRFKS